MTIKISASADHKNLRTLCVIRLIPLLGLVVTGCYFFLGQDILLPWANLVTLVTTLGLLVIATWWRSYQPWPVKKSEFVSQLFADILLFSLLLFYTGGASNPFVSYYLVPVAIAAITLPRTLTWLVASVCLIAYSLLLFWHFPVPALSPVSGHEHHNAPSLNLHIVGMWANFAVSALLIAYFVTRMASTIREQNDAIRSQREQALEDEQLLAVATLAASAAHELGTPLNTVRLILEDWPEQGVTDHPSGTQSDRAILLNQIDRCQQTLQKLAATARSFSSEPQSAQAVADYFHHVMESWLVIRPDVQAQIEYADGNPDVRAWFHPTLAASLHNLLNNAGDSSPDRVDITIAWNQTEATITIRDHGKRPYDKTLDNRGLMASDKTNGMGIGLFLSRRILNRHGGEIDIQPHPQGGTVVEVTLPFEGTATP